MPEGGCTVTIPIRIEIDASVAHAVEIVEDALGAALSRALASSFDAVVRTRSARPAVGAWPAFTWGGDGLPLVDAAARMHLEAAVVASVRAQVQTWPDAGGGSAAPGPAAPVGLPSMPANVQLAATDLERASGAHVAMSSTESWTRWLGLAAGWESGSGDAAPGAAGAHEATADGREAIRTVAFAERLGRAISFVPDVARITTAGFAPEPNWNERLSVMVRELERGFIAAFAAALERRDILYGMTALAIVPLVSIVTTYLAQDAFRAERISAQALMRALGRAFPATDLRQVCGAPANVDYDSLIYRNVELEIFFEALAIRGFDDTDARAATVNFVHGLFEALAGAYEQLMLEAVNRVVAVERAFRSNADGARLAGAQSTRLTEEFERAVATIANRTPQAALASGRETNLVAERLHASLRTLSARSSVWRADIRAVPNAAEGAWYVLALLPPDLGADDIAYYESAAGYGVLHDVLRAYAVMSDQWHASGALGLAWRTGIARLDAVLAVLVARLRDEEPARAAFFLDQPYG